jgi:hypothetical protein
MVACASSPWPASHSFPSRWPSSGPAFAWFENRQPLTDQITLTAHRSSCPPTWPDAGVTLWCCWWRPSTTSSTWLPADVLAGCALVGMHVNTPRLRASSTWWRTPPCNASAFFDLKRPAPATACAAASGCRLTPTPAPHPGCQNGQSTHWAWTDSGPGNSSCAWPLPPAWFALVLTLTAETRFPLGTFRSGRSGGQPP